MKTVVKFIFLLWGCLLFGCAAPKNLTSSTSEATFSEEKRSERETGDFSSRIDTTKTDGLKITYTKIEYYPPDTSGDRPADNTNEGSESPAEGNRPETPAASDREKQPPDQGAIKSIETFTLEATHEEAGIAETEESTTSEKDEEINTGSTADNNTEESVADDPYRWRYIFFILILIIGIGTAGYFAIRKTKVFSFFRRRK